MFEFIDNSESALKAYFDHNFASLDAIVLGLFAGINSVRIVAYVPQILKAARDTNGASAISCTTWGLFLASHLTTIIYAIVSLGDLVMAAIFFGNSIACLAIILVAMRKRRTHRSHTLRKS